MTTNEPPWSVDEIGGERARSMLHHITTELGITPDWRGEQAELQVLSALRQLKADREQERARANELQAQIDAFPYETGAPVGDRVAARIAEYRERTKQAEAHALKAEAERQIETGRADKLAAERDAELGEAYRRGWRACEVEKEAERAEKVWTAGADAAYAAVYADIADTYGIASSTETRPVDRVNEVIQAVAERVKTAEAEIYSKALELVALQVAVLDIPVSSGGAACNDDYVRIARDAKHRIEELELARQSETDHADNAENALHLETDCCDSETGQCTRRAWDRPGKTKPVAAHVESARLARIVNAHNSRTDRR